MNKVVVVGAGAWGTALAIQAARAGSTVDLVARDPQAARQIDATRSNPRLPGMPLPPVVQVRTDISPDADLLIWAIPMQQIRASLLRFQPGPCPIVICAKGVETNTGLLPLEVVADVPRPGPAAVLSGPNFALEVAKGLPAASVVGTTDPALRDLVRASLGSSTFRLYGNSDPVGVQLGGAAKNVVAIAAGAVIGAGLGENARAALVTRGLSEIRRLIVAQGGQADTAMGLSGLGDLLLTCTGAASRNFSLGLALGSGQPLQAILAAATSTIEGVATAKALVARAASADLPICRAVADLLDGVKTLEQAVESLLSRPQRDE
ncbi:MAG: glycerol-3-phosphate dehydrogenase [Rhodospirillales bacterium 20-64-7]|nr:MAG: glycerol-3-phosphate dehydrogenase [Rhodospirillales bacterium 20-64-7]HQT76187.1 NAD(P)H-dependent glycerol-3-phosphate dehydrogenase [Rhodopila sp.]